MLVCVWVEGNDLVRRFNRERRWVLGVINRKKQMNWRKRIG